jgi:formylglycine-generating enzyme required for sulfatase activity
MTSLLDQLRGPLEPTSGVLGGPNILVSWGEGHLMWRYGRDKGEGVPLTALRLRLTRSAIPSEGGGWLGRLLTRSRPELLLHVELELPERTLYLKGRVDEDLVLTLPEGPPRGAEVNGAQLAALILGVAAEGATVQGLQRSPTPPPRTPEALQTIEISAPKPPKEVQTIEIPAPKPPEEAQANEISAPEPPEEAQANEISAPEPPEEVQTIEIPAPEPPPAPEASEIPAPEPPEEAPPALAPPPRLLPGVEIPAGTLLLGSPEEEIGRNEWEEESLFTLEAPVWMAQTPVTRARWREVMGFDPSQASPAGALEHPVDGVSWCDAVAFCNALSALEGRQPAYALSDVRGAPGEPGFRLRARPIPEADGYRLPPSALWEYACRAGTRTPTWATPLDAIAVYADNSGGGTQPVAQRAPNPWGLHDMLGNVLEWCEDGDPDREGCVARGGAWDAPAASCRAAEWDSYQAHARSPRFGVRVWATPPGA